MRSDTFIAAAADGPDGPDGLDSPGIRQRSSCPVWFDRVATLVCVFGGLYMYRDRMGGAIFGEKNFLSFSVLKKVLKFLIRIRRARGQTFFAPPPGRNNSLEHL